MSKARPKKTSRKDSQGNSIRRGDRVRLLNDVVGMKFVVEDPDEDPVAVVLKKGTVGIVEDFDAEVAGDIVLNFGMSYRGKASLNRSGWDTKMNAFVMPSDIVRSGRPVHRAYR